MTEKELKRLSRKQLLEMLIVQTECNEQLENQLAEVKKQLECRIIKEKKAGSIAEAALKLNSVFEAAQNAANQYLENIHYLEEEQKNLCNESQNPDEIKK